MIPETYNRKKEFYPNVCKSCDWLCNAFRKALLEGDCDKAMAIFSTGNVNLYTPFANVKGELFYPIHCAVLGDSLDLLRMLVDENCCPIKSVRANNSQSTQVYTPILTSKGRSVLGIALSNENLEIARYLVVEKGVDIASQPDVTMDLLCKNFVKVMQFLPSSLVPGGDEPEIMPQEQASIPLQPDPSVASLSTVPRDDAQRTISEEARDFGAVAVNSGSGTSYGECKL